MRHRRVSQGSHNHTGYESLLSVNVGSWYCMVQWQSGYKHMGYRITPGQRRAVGFHVSGSFLLLIE